MRKLAFCFCLTALCSFTALAQTRGQLSKNFLKGKHIIHTHPNPSAFKVKGNIPAPHGFPAGVDTITNFTGHFQAQGIYSISATAGINHNIWEYSMVGNRPDQGGTTDINAPVIPVTVDMRNPDGSPPFVTTTAQNCPTCTPAQPGQNVGLISRPDPFSSLFMNGPRFQNADYTSSPVPTQIMDAEQIRLGVQAFFATSAGTTLSMENLFCMGTSELGVNLRPFLKSKKEFRVKTAQQIHPGI